mmetsp:Transcript_29831/g.77002  ORF Transcript_29831/g.77002 Transcript_29831/m.77002 type:complete len:441 (-) Transcript_29831:679-2001(-)
METSSHYPMESMDVALKKVVDAARLLEEEEIDVSSSIGRIASRPVYASHPFPPFRASIKDGYAVRCSDCPGELEISCAVRAGNSPLKALPEKTAAYITTGSPVPDGADAVVQVEDTHLFPSQGRTVVQTSRGPIPEVGDIVKFLRAVNPGEDIRPIGCDIESGTVLLEENEEITSVTLGLLSAFNISTVFVTRRPVVALFSTGDELVNFGERADPGQVVDSNRPMLKAMVEQLGAVVLDGKVLRDSQEVLDKRILEIVSTADVVITSGGVSMGSHDLIKPLLERHSSKILFGRLCMKPGKPTTVAIFEGKGRNGRNCIFFGLPGNPVSCNVTSNLFVAPVLLKMQGKKSPGFPRVKCRLEGSAISLDRTRPEYHRVTVRVDENGQYHCASTGQQASSRLLSVRRANALVEVPKGEGTIQPNETVWALLLDLPGHSLFHVS